MRTETEVAGDRPRAAAHWALDPDVVFLNHGSFGACPKPVLEAQRRWRERMERQPVQFFVRDLEGLLDEARLALAEFVNADARGLVFVRNATTAVNAVVRSLRFEPGDELLTTSHEYNACANALRFAAERWGATVVVAEVPFPIESAEQVVEAILSRVTSRTRLALIDHVTSPTGLVWPIERIVRELAERGVDTLVDGAHAPGMIPLDIRAIGAAHYTGNLHKWVCAPKGAAFLAVREDRRDRIRPTVISHGANSSRIDRPRLLLEFDWTGTADPTAILSVPEALRFMGTVAGGAGGSGGWPALMGQNRSLALRGRQLVCERLGVKPPCPAEMVGSMASIPLPDSPPGADASTSPLYLDPLQDTLLERFGVEVPVIPWPAPPRRLVRLSAQAYNSEPQYERLAAGLDEALRAERGG